MPSDEYFRRTAITRLTDLSREDERLLFATIDEWRDACNLASDLAWKRYETKSDMQDLAYDRIRDETELGSQHAVLACHEVASVVTSCTEKLRNGKKASKPRFTARSITYDRRSMTVFPAKEQVSLTTLGDHARVRADLALPAEDDGYQYAFLDGEGWEYTESTLHYRDDEWYLHLGFRKLKADNAGSTTENGTVLGVDLGVNQIAVTSTARFFDAGELNHMRREFEKTRAGLQETGTQSAHRTLEARRGRERRYVRHVLHTVANGIVEEALEHGCDGIVFEDLEEIRMQLPEANWHSDWAFRTLKKYVKYKAEIEGLFIETIQPRNTSKQCAECGFTGDENRTGSEFECQSCGNRNHADYNAAKNVAKRYLRRGHQSSRRRGVSQYALKSGSRTPS
ncbi:transposase, IS605 OrfB family [Haloterrigena turkmenica DSM 5511]|uniref:Transposase, IS605 OrfB family n=1 Tax=Haloterrigena turkmenica (strain ATCC 51198 / DSM 5511 / JCM 9101 / NCIMB 13204 / VKM B-1734 / 4k) TaxID=543526 RepID=D2RYS9_HALTV|nr:RNA-guided endonuclease TnpB family protein [Haloterrigena turkmenica]ADB61897.1 transposase, IS605 OrfB family [Haloterrigena turkmenica DSM 5511]